ncbi:MAG: bifunctional folylpolyglutamate synthase/dihydrofolate synthase, partial [Symploca sp. SIO2C1]|nr:bifunctional folylpolyglutamate synthase/dihydrofolate synthase [Symploca sp. SIO2C1]
MSLIPNSIDELEEWTVSRIPGQQEKLLRFKTLLELLNISIPPSSVIKLAGTNGKGSVGAMLEAIFLADAQKVILFTSPHLSRVTERLRVDGVEISPDVLNDAVQQLAPKLVRIVNEYGNYLLPSFFEALTLIALEYFKSYGADIIILEAGIGGYFDIVHLVPAEVSLITNVGLDHTEDLGTTFSEIATDKAGIASPNSTLVLGSDIPESALKAILED